MLQCDNTALVLIDVQEKLLPAIHEWQRLLDAAVRLLRGVKVLELPIVWTEQNPRRLGRTVQDLAELLPGEPIEKLSFSCGGQESFNTSIQQSGRNQILLAGIETHVCVYQTAMDLMAAGFEVHVVADAVSSRTDENRRIALDKMSAAGVQITSVEMALLEMLKVAEGPKFKEILRIIK